MTEEQPFPEMSGIAAAIALCDNDQGALGKRLGVSKQAVSYWFNLGHVPVKRAVEIEATLGIARKRLIDPALLDILS